MELPANMVPMGCVEVWWDFPSLEEAKNVAIASVRVLITLCRGASLMTWLESVLVYVFCGIFPGRQKSHTTSSLDMAMRIFMVNLNP